MRDPNDLANEIRVLQAAIRLIDDTTDATTLEDVERVRGVPGENLLADETGLPQATVKAILRRREPVPDQGAIYHVHRDGTRHEMTEVVGSIQQFRVYDVEKTGRLYKCPEPHDSISEGILVVWDD